MKQSVKNLANRRRSTRINPYDLSEIGRQREENKKIQDVKSNTNAKVSMMERKNRQLEKTNKLLSERLAYLERDNMNNKLKISELETKLDSFIRRIFK